MVIWVARSLLHALVKRIETMSWVTLLSATLFAAVLLARCGPGSATPRGGGGGGGERSKLLARAHPRFGPRRHPTEEDLSLDDDDFMEAPKRTYSDYGHMRFGKRDDKFDEYGHMRFGRAEY